MNLIICLDDSFGYAFCGRRQSMDRVLRCRALELTAGEPLYMDAYSVGQFQDCAHRIRVVADPEKEVPGSGWFFLELGDPERLLPTADQLAVFHWNRQYPSDRRFPLDRIREQSQPVFQEVFPGNSHDTITLEVYQL